MFCLQKRAGETSTGGIVRGRRCPGGYVEGEMSGSLPEDGPACHLAVTTRNASYATGTARTSVILENRYRINKHR